MKLFDGVVEKCDKSADEEDSWAQKTIAQILRFHASAEFGRFCYFEIKIFFLNYILELSCFGE